MARAATLCVENDRRGKRLLQQIRGASSSHWCLPMLWALARRHALGWAEPAQTVRARPDGQRIAKKRGFREIPFTVAAMFRYSQSDGAGCRFSGPPPQAFGFRTSDRFSVLPSVLVPLGEP
jgi:hypothetical protein